MPGTNVHLERQLAREGIPVQATLEKKFELADGDRTTYHLRYSFQVGSRVISSESRVDQETYGTSRE